MTGLPILTYHALDTSGSVISTPPKTFADTMAAIFSEGFRCVDLQAWIEAGRPEVDRGFALAFDDGFRSILPAAETLARFGFVATAFLVTGRMGLDNQWPGQPNGVPISPLLQWSDLNALTAAGFRFGAHTLDHPILPRCAETEVDRQLSGSKTAIEDATGRSCRRARPSCIARECAEGMGSGAESFRPGRSRSRRSAAASPDWCVPR